MTSKIEINNWEDYFDQYFEFLISKPVKKQHNKGVSITYANEEVYVWCDLNSERNLINKLEFGRFVKDSNGHQETNWIKGVFINDGLNYLNFLQTSFDSEYFDKKTNYTISYNEGNRLLIEKFLKNTLCNRLDGKRI